MDSPPPQLSSPSGVLKRKRKRETYKDQIVKRDRNLGKSYKSRQTGRIVGEREIGAPCTCTNNCFEKVGRENIEILFSEFWELGNYDFQCSYVQGHSEDYAVVRPRPRSLIPTKQRSVSRHYHVCVNNEKIKVCFAAFASILGHNKATLQRMLKKKTPSGALIPDMRGKHGNHSRIPDEMQQLAIEHIASIPTVTSHYTRVTNTNALYIDGSIKSMSELYKMYYLVWLKDNHPGKQPVKEHYYVDVKNKHFPNLHLEKPKQDTCSKCDGFKIKLQEASSSEEKKKIEIERNIHWSKAQKGYDIITSLKSK